MGCVESSGHGVVSQNEPQELDKRKSMSKSNNIQPLLCVCSACKRNPHVEPKVILADPKPRFVVKSRRNNGSKVFINVFCDPVLVHLVVGDRMLVETDKRGVECDRFDVIVPNDNSYFSESDTQSKVCMWRYTLNLLVMQFFAWAMVALLLFFFFLSSLDSMLLYF